MLTYADEGAEQAEEALLYYCFTAGLLLVYCCFQVHKVRLEEIGGLEEAKEALYEMLVLPREQAELCRRYQAC
jgi:hypothetical protein